MNAPVILITASAALADGWADSLGLQDALRLPDLAALNRANVVADSLVLLDLAAAAPREQDMQQACQHCRVLALSSLPSDEEGMQWLQYGAAAYAHAMSTPDLLQQVFDTVQSGGTWVGRSIMQQLCARFGRQLPAKTETDWRSRLSAREQDVVEALREGRANKDIARQLDISERTVKAHLTSVFQKFGVEDRLQLLLKLTGR
ncbi:response regulator transcription factor [Aquitalea sp. LB_tupeE]|uniref:helix-turn-helix transcriptional regulator n=1 Tax=Aquitalea sp. LB_tupeE TaxID=2748078 RepID=UPI0015B83EB4|nr:response regulator transcription factor [Aquitalea sp. LB_tupeE]NWK78018.1 response regulator transcription factor [Aquitalea sp. LB_tupeE]